MVARRSLDPWGRMTAPAARDVRIARLRRRVWRHARRRDELEAQARVEGLFVVLLRERLAALEAQEAEWIGRRMIDVEAQR
jgi:hypothetical protein